MHTLIALLVCLLIVAFAWNTEAPSSPGTLSGRLVYTFPLSSYSDLISMKLPAVLQAAGQTLSAAPHARATEIHFQSEGINGKAFIDQQKISDRGIDAMMAFAWWRAYTPEHRAALAQHQALLVLQLDCQFSSRQRQLERLTSVISGITQCPEVIGVMSPSAMHYTPSSMVSSLIGGNPDRSIGQFSLLMNLHKVTIGGETWIHTHGMEQFGLPDIELWVRTTVDHSPDTERVLNAAHYQIASQRDLKLGDSFDLRTETSRYVIAPARPSTDSDHFGPQGAIQLELQKP